MIQIPHLTCTRIVSDKLSKDDVMGLAYYVLNQTLGSNDAAFLFSTLARAFGSNNIFEPRDRLSFRDDVIKTISQWLNQDFQGEIEIAPGNLRRFWSTFSDLDVRPPKFFKDYLDNQMRVNSGRLTAKDGLSAIAYFSDLGMIMPPVLFDVACKPIVESVSLLTVKERIEFFSHIAILSAVNRDMAYREFSPQRIHDMIPKGIGNSEISSEDLKSYHVCRQEMADFWFTNKNSETSYPYKGGRKLTKIDFPFPSLDRQEIRLTECFRQTESAPSKLGIDAIYSFPNHRDVGCMIDSRTHYVPQMDKDRTSYPNGIVQFNSAALNRIMPDDIILRLSKLVLKHMHQDEIGAVIVEAGHLKSGVYGLNAQRQIVPFKDLVLVT